MKSRHIAAPGIDRHQPRQRNTGYHWDERFPFSLCAQEMLTVPEAQELKFRLFERVMVLCAVVAELSGTLSLEFTFGGNTPTAIAGIGYLRIYHGYFYIRIQIITVNANLLKGMRSGAIDICRGPRELVLGLCIPRITVSRETAAAGIIT